MKTAGKKIPTLGKRGKCKDVYRVAGTDIVQDLPAQLTSEEEERSLKRNCHQSVRLILSKMY